MQASLTSKAGGVSFANDPKALALLLYALIERAAGSADGVVLAGEVAGIARDIGYRGPIASVRRLLLAQGFLVEHEKGVSFSFQEENRAAMRQFFLEHERLPSGPGLSAEERDRLFGRLTDGTETERVAVRIMRLFSSLLVEFDKLPHLERDVRVGIAREESAYLIAIERAGWLTERMDAAFREAEEARLLFTFGGQMRSARAVINASDTEKLLNQASIESGGHAEALHVLARQEELLVLLRAFREFLDQFIRGFVVKEGGG